MKNRLANLLLIFSLLLATIPAPHLRSVPEEDRLLGSIVEVFTAMFYNVTQRILHKFAEGVLREDSWIKAVNGVLHLFESKAVNLNITKYESTKLISFRGEDLSFRHDYGNSGLRAAVGASGDSLRTLIMRESVIINVRGKELNYQTSAMGQGNFRTGAIWYWGETIEDIVYYREDVSGLFSITRIVSMGEEVPPAHPGAP